MVLDHKVKARLRAVVMDAALQYSQRQAHKACQWPGGGLYSGCSGADGGVVAVLASGVAADVDAGFVGRQQCYPTT